MMQRRIGSMRGVAMIAALLGCGGDGASDPGTGGGTPVVAQVRLDPADSVAMVGLGVTGTVRATALTAAGASVDAADVTWSVDDATVASIAPTTTRSGLLITVTATARGRTTLRASAGGKVASVPLVVRADVQRVVVSTPQLEMSAVGQALPVQANVVADPGVATTLTWTSANPTVAGVGPGAAASGQPVTITSHGAGSTQVIARSTADTSRTAVIVVNVTVPQVQDVRISPTSATIVRGSTATMSATVIGQPGIATDVAWFSDDPTIASVSPTSVASGASVTVTAIRAGSTRIRAVSAQDATKSATSDVTVPVPVVNAIAVSAQTLRLERLGTTSVSATVTGSAGAVTDVLWGSNDPSIVTVGAARTTSGAPVLLTAVAVGQATVNALSAEDTTKQATIAVTVEPPPVASISVTLGAPSLDVGQATQAQAVAFDAQGNALPGRAVTWASSAPSVAAVSAAGLVTAVGAGTATISATADGKVGQAALTVRSVAPVINSVSITPPALTIPRFNTATAAAAVNASAGADTDVLWRSSDPSIATVAASRTASGAPIVITAVSVGQATIRALSAGDTTKLATIAVTVGPPAVASVSITLGSPALEPGQSTQAQAVLLDVRGNTLTGRTVAWSTTTPAMITVSSSGLVSAVGYGTATIIATSEGQVASAALSVQPLFSDVSTGNNHTCARTSAGRLWCFGSGAYGTFGTGSPPPSYSLPLVPAFPAAPAAAQVTVGNVQTCIRTSAGAVWCAGENTMAALSSTVPVQLAGAPALAHINGSMRTTCGLTSAGVAWCWGSNGLGQLGDGTTTDRATPVAVLGGHQFTVVRAGYNHSCGVTAAGEAWCWGYNQYGQLGDNSTTDAPAPVRVQGGLVFADVHVGAMHTCGRTTTGAAWCWGANYFGQLGNGTTTNATTPVQVQSNGVTFDEISSIGSHACGRTGTVLRCWGWNNNGQLGNGAFVNTAAPVLVSGSTAFTQVSAGNTQTCALSTARQLWCWGADTRAQPDGSPAVSQFPVVMR